MLMQDTNLLWLVGLGGGVMALALLKGITLCSATIAGDQITQHREVLSQRRADRAAAEAAGRAAAKEPLALNPDGTIQEPIIATVES